MRPSPGMTASSTPTLSAGDGRVPTLTRRGDRVECALDAATLRQGVAGASEAARAASVEAVMDLEAGAEIAPTRGATSLVSRLLVHVCECKNYYRTSVLTAVSNLRRPIIALLLSSRSVLFPVLFFHFYFSSMSSSWKDPRK